MGFVDSARKSYQAVHDFLFGRQEDAESADSVLEAERDAIGHARRAKALEDSPPSDFIGLSFSGGGIRSATFNLGVLQGLARYGLLPHVDYLSTVSGGGYIGSWLVAWMKRLAESEEIAQAKTKEENAEKAYEARQRRALSRVSAPRQAGAPRPERSVQDVPMSAYVLERVQELLRPDQARPDSPDLEPIRNLRRYSNYLTPRVSVLSADTWSMVAIWFRNTLLNLLIVVCLITVGVVVPRFVGLGLNAWRNAAPTMWSWSIEGLLSLATLTVSAFFISMNLRGVSRRARQEERKAAGERIVVDHQFTLDQSQVQWRILFPGTLGAAAIAAWIYREPAYFVQHWSTTITVALIFGFAVITCLGGFPDGFAARQAHPLKPTFKWRVLAYIAGLILSVIVGFVTAAMLYGLTRGIGAIGTMPDPSGGNWLPWIVAAFGPPGVLAVLALGLALQVGLAGRDMPDPSREWLGRLRAWSIIYAGVWAGIFTVAYFGPWILYRIGMWAAAAAGAGWTLATAAGLVAGNSERTNGAGVKDLRDTAKEFVAIAAPYVFMAGVFFLVSLGIHELVSTDVRTDLRHPPGPSATLPGTPDSVTLTVGAREGAAYNHFEARLHTYASDLTSATTGQWVGVRQLGSVDLRNLTMLLLTALAGGLILAWRVDINDFSMHYFYKNRLVRCYLGASRTRVSRQPDSFTGFDGGDDYPLACLQAPRVKTTSKQRADYTNEFYCGPYPIVNATLNVSGGNGLAWQERQAVSYVFTPLFSGFDKTLVDRETRGLDPAVPRTYAYRPTDECGYVGGIYVGQAMAISGAAASPNSGYHTSTSVAFFLTILNARLGWWLGNPSLMDFYKKSSPEWGLPYLLTELFGLANTNRRYVNLSDGGHFDNLGIYELVRRRCQYVIACDGEQDGDMTFGGLASVIRKCRTDFGAVIEINVDQLRLNGDRLSAAHCAVGTITYDDGQIGRLLYLKSSLTGNEDPDVLEYRARNPQFPHQSTSDQWFDESQFESYRRLGLHVAESAFGGIDLLNLRPDATYAAKKAAFFEDIALKHYPPSKLVEQAFTKHTEMLTDRLESFASNRHFQVFDDSVFSEWTDTGGKPHDRDFERSVRYWCNSIIQLMENAYVDLDLDDPKERLHPDNAGWLQLFRRWAVTPVFSRTWAIVQSTYGARFQRFFEHLQSQEGDRITGRWEADGDASSVPGLAITGLAFRRSNANGHWALEGKAVGTDGRETALQHLDFNGLRVTFNAVGTHRYRLTLDKVKDPSRAVLAVSDRPEDSIAFRRVHYAERAAACFQ